jgi:cytochrome c-type biogenesis protein CcmF
MDVGEILLILSLFFSAVSCIAFLQGVRKGSVALVLTAEKALYVYTLTLTIAFFLLLYYFLVRDFNVIYVYLYSDLHLPLLYTISAVWAGREGSLLLWAWYLALINTAFVRGKKDRVTALSLAISSSIVLFFSALLITTSNPFLRFNFYPSNGIGLNPLLRTLEMAFHPPTIFVGYAGITIPFALAISGVLYEEKWIKRARYWLLFSWIFLTVGIFLGAWWAYKTLGWGGFWAWDPVENASLLPWLSASALIHGMMVEGRRGSLKTLNYFLAVLTFNLVILATFITRSGIISSVHAFAQTPESAIYLLIIAAATFLGIAVWRLKKKYFFDSKLKGLRETAILANILILLLSTLTVLLGTIIPVFADVSINRSYYDKLEIPLGTALVILLGICSAISWKVDKHLFVKKSKVSAIVGIAIGIVVFAAFKAAIASIGAAIFFFSLLNHLQDFSIKDLANRRKYGGYIVHIGIIFLFIGVMGAWLYDTSYTNVVVEKGKNAQCGQFELKLVGITLSEDAEKVIVAAKVEVYEDRLLQGVIYPKQFFYKLNRQDRVVSTVEILSQPARDIYVAMGGISNDFQRVYLEFYIIPLVSFVWIGSTMIVVGGVYAMIPRK